MFNNSYRPDAGATPWDHVRIVSARQFSIAVVQDCRTIAAEAPSPARSEDVMCAVKRSVTSTVSMTAAGSRSANHTNHPFADVG